MMSDSYSELLSVLLAIIGLFFVWISTWLLYGFGKIIDKLTDIERNTKGEHNVTKSKEDTDNDVSSENFEKLRKKGIITEGEYEDFTNLKAVI